MSKLSVLIANPTGDLYGADVQLLATVRALCSQGHQVRVIVGSDGPLRAKLAEVGAVVEVGGFPILTRADKSPRKLLALAPKAARGVRLARASLRAHRPDVLLVNTITLPWWLLAARLERVPAVAHCHECETDGRLVVRRGLYAPLRLADHVIANSAATLDAIGAVWPKLRGKTTVVPNGVAGPNQPLAKLTEANLLHACVVGRISPLKATHLAVEALALVRAAGFDATLDIVGTAMTEREDYGETLRLRCARPDVADAVRFRGYVSPVWTVLADVGVLLAPSLMESFGNAVVEAGLAGRACIVSDAAGHTHTVTHHETGLVVPRGDGRALAQAWLRLLAEPATARGLASAAQHRFGESFSLAAYGTAIEKVLTAAAQR